MSDIAHKYTTKEIAELRKQITIVYREAEKDIQKKMDDFNARYKVKEQKHLQEVAAGAMSQKEFDQWKAGQVFQGQRWQAKKDDIIDTIHHSNEIATKMINGNTQNVFAMNANYMSYELEHGAGINFGFDVYDSNTVSRLIKDDPQLLPKWKIDKPKDYTWNQKKVNNAITQGIIQGESLDKISKRLAHGLATQNKNKMNTFARTAMTGAQNSGRQMQLENAKKMGIDLMKEWIASLDSHTRDSHAQVDGEQVEVEKKFSNGLMFPGEPGGAPAETYNCRCSMASELKKYPSVYNRYDNLTGERIRNMSYRDWENAKKNGKNMAPYNANTIANKYFFGSLSQNGAYTKIHDLDVTLANQFYKTLQNMGQSYADGVKAAKVWQDYVKGNLPKGISSDKLDEIIAKYRSKASNTLITPQKTLNEPVKAPKTSQPIKPIPKPKNADISKFKTTEEWLDAIKKNPSTGNMLKAEKKLFETLSEAEKKALKDYTGNAYRSMNNYLRLLGSGMSESEAARKAGLLDMRKDEIELCKKALNTMKLDRDMVFRRGTDFGDLAGLFMKGDFVENKNLLAKKSAEELNEMFQGEMGTYFGFTSTSSQWDKGFSGKVEVIINAPKGTPAASIMSISDFGTSEGETLLNANTKVRCEKIEKSDGHFDSKIRMFLTIIN